ncbi:hypothetical protein VTP01DRAFT_603 [Rhizomucor pusillus]|uniref:uncharacterized protein n=1 Tax=Rhizomucor pusillus TaxID=4840 RepID=UPI003743AE3B
MGRLIVTLYWQAEYLSFGSFYIDNYHILESTNTTRETKLPENIYTHEVGEGMEHKYKIIGYIYVYNGVKR